MAMAITLKPNLRILAITPCRHLSSSPFPPFPSENPFSDIKKNLKPSQPPSHVVHDSPPPPPSSDNGGKNPNISEIQMHLSQFRQQNPFRNANPNSGPISIQDIMNRRANNQNTQNTNTRMNFDAISESLKNFRPNPQSSMRGFNLFPNRRNPETPTVRNLDKSKLPESVFGKELREKFGVEEEAETGKLASTEFLKIYTHEELGQKLKSLRPEDSQEGKNDWFSLEELNVRLSKLRELEQKEKDQKVHGLSLAALTDSLKHITQRETMNRNKQTAQSMSIFANFNSLMTPNYTLKPPQEQLLDNYFHPDHMSSAEKMKLELKKVRDEYKMSESDCGSTRVQIAQLTTKIKHLSSVLHKKDKHSRKGLNEMVQKRKKLLKYLRRTDWDSYTMVLSKLGLRDVPEYKVPDYKC